MDVQVTRNSLEKSVDVSFRYPYVGDVSGTIVIGKPNGKSGIFVLDGRRRYKLFPNGVPKGYELMSGSIRVPTDEEDVETEFPVDFSLWGKRDENDTRETFDVEEPFLDLLQELFMEEMDQYVKPVEKPRRQVSGFDVGKVLYSRDGMGPKLFKPKGEFNGISAHHSTYFDLETCLLPPATNPEVIPNLEPKKVILTGLAHGEIPYSGEKVGGPKIQKMEVEFSGVSAHHDKYFDLETALLPRATGIVTPEQKIRLHNVFVPGHDRKNPEKFTFKELYLGDLDEDDFPRAEFEEREEIKEDGQISLSHLGYTTFKFEDDEMDMKPCIVYAFKVIGTGRPEALREELDALIKNSDNTTRADYIFTRGGTQFVIGFITSGVTREITTIAKKAREDGFTRYNTSDISSVPGFEDIPYNIHNGEGNKVPETKPEYKQQFEWIIDTFAE